ncbi:dihydropteroate synthase [Schumannella luteola]|uniref:Dihydropteroate synthase n=2 Tax=Protaetiibacter mangrovi TaxID=2970926 RepID=A0ABT1ZDQ4_9MICO|nr:dihydropteroate synthase [Protaetiibacter mangrovi]MCS0498820.1 dihydropteroate synthase [Protaetiibacter mangrovi]TPX02763.1 dihydropteroate synthase [Schumannella luteola]
MAIVNRTPDSFHDKGATFALEKAVDAALAAVADGADWVDVGGVPFGRGPVVELAEELERIVPLVARIRAASDVVISVDTFSGAVAAASLAAGADVVNDTSGLWDPEMAPAVASAGGHLVLTHSLTPPRTPHPSPRYDDVVDTVVAHLHDRIETAVAAGVPFENLIVDPGHDLNKNTLHSLELTRRLGEIAALGPPVLVALSNKDFIGETLDRPQYERLEGSLAAAVASILNGARIVRVHDVRASVAAVRMTEAILGWREPAWLKHNM